MTDAFVYPSIYSAMNDRYRGHDSRNWQVWHDQHFYSSASEILAGADRALIRRVKGNVTGLGGRQNLVHLIAGNVDQAMMKDIARLKNLQRLELTWPMMAEDLSPLTDLPNLQFLSIDGPRNVTDFAMLASMPRLRTLLVSSAKHLSTLNWLEGADHLRVIGVEGGMDTKQVIASLAPLARLARLEAFLGTSLRLLDGDLMPLATCPNLKFIGIARVTKKPVFDRLREARPDIICNWFEDSMWGKPGLRAA